MLGPPGSPFEGVPLYFELEVPPSYPFKPPRVTCHSRCWHPNICPNSGQVALSILEEDWRPTLSLSTLIFGVQLALVEPNIDLAVNAAAADTYTHDPERFHAQVQEVLGGHGAWRPGNSSSRSSCSCRGREGGREGIRPHPMQHACGAVTGGGGLVSPRGRSSLSHDPTSSSSSNSSSSSSSGGNGEDGGSARKRKVLHQVEPPERGLEAMCIDDSSSSTCCSNSSSSSNSSGNPNAINLPTYPPEASMLLELSHSEDEGKPLSRPGSGQHNKRARSVGGGGGGEGGSGGDLVMLAAAAAAAGHASQQPHQQYQQEQQYRQQHQQHHSMSFPFSMMMANEDGGPVKAPPPAS